MTALFYAINYFFPHDWLSEIFDDDVDECERIAACKCSISEGELKEVLQYLVVEKGMKINSVNKVAFL